MRVDGPSAPPTPDQDLAGLDRASRAFESLLLRELIRVMVAGSTEGGFFGKGAAGETWEDLFETGLSDSLAGRGNLGIAGLVYRQFEQAVRAQAAKPQESPGSADPERGT